ncbi:MAG: DinB family protein [Pseudomonadaceae bacterium]|nr:DinB family protein [Pseudomonadaceae bacterium]
MISKAHIQLMSQYSQWMNQKLYETCAQLDDSKRRENLGAFFGSIHLTLNHLLHGDRMFLSRFEGRDEQFAPLGSDLFPDFNDLRSARKATDEHMQLWAQNVDEEWLGQTLTYTSMSDGKTRTVAHWILVTHLFNHGIHHRGQVTTLLSQLGLDIGDTDIPFMPMLDLVEGSARNDSTS